MTFTLANQSTTAVVDGAEEVRTGQGFEVFIAPPSVHVFDRVTGLRID